MSSQFYSRAALFPGKDPSVLTEKKAGWDTGAFLMLWRRENRLLLLGIEPHFLGLHLVV
jgi:hypothetical protein